MKKRHTQKKTRLLSLVHTNGDIGNVLRYDYNGSYWKLAQDIDKLTKSDLVTVVVGDKYDKYVLSDVGISYLKKVNRFKEKK